MIVELYGSPGAGKTYIKDRVIPGEVEAANRKNRKWFVKFVKRAVLLFPFSFICRKKIYEIIGGHDYKPIYNNVTVSSCVNNIVMVLYGYTHLKSKKRFMDEGVIHRIISLSVNYNFHIKTVFEIIDYVTPFLGQIKEFYLYLNPEECYKSIKERDRHECNIDELDDESLRKYLDAYKYYCDAVCQKYRHSLVTREDYKEIEKVFYD
jgi:hypothetical protein